MDTIEWNKVTWYSQTLAVVLFVAVFFAGYSLGKGSAESQNSDNALSDGESAIVLQQASSTPSDLIDGTTFYCKENKSIAAKFYAGRVDIVLSDGRSFSMKQTPSKADARYATEYGSTIFWNRGNGATLQEGMANTYIGCYSK